MQQPQQAAADPLKGHPKYKTVRALSSGSFGFVHLCQNLQTQEFVAIKFIERGDKISHYVEAEVLNHRQLRHPHVIEYKEVFLTEQFICIAMEYASGGNLFSYVQTAVRLQERAARWFFQQLIIGLDYCHKKGVVNRDIKLENTLLTMVEGLPLPLLKICDFGYSKAQYMSAPKSKVGTMAYMAPEVIKAQGQYDGKQADLWSCGVMLYVMLFGHYPFEDPTTRATVHATRVQNMMQRILAMDWRIPSEVAISAECRDLLTKLLVSDPTKRVSMEQIQAHPWFLQNLPPDALKMNDDFLKNADYSGVQSVDEIKRILASAYLPGQYTFTVENDENYEDVIDHAINEELIHNTPSIAQPPPEMHRVRVTGAVPGQQQATHTMAQQNGAPQLAAVGARQASPGQNMAHTLPQQPVYTPNTLQAGVYVQQANGRSQQQQVMYAAQNPGQPGVYGLQNPMPQAAYVAQPGTGIPQALPQQGMMQTGAIFPQGPAMQAPTLVNQMQQPHMGNALRPQQPQGLDLL